jgi:hypothetical protein
MFTDAYLAAEHAARVQREWADEASRSRLARLATHFERCVDQSASLLDRVTAAFRPSQEPCSSSC